MDEKLIDFLIFKNNRKTKDNHPDYTISAKIDDKLQQIGSCWLRDGKDGNKFFSCTLSKPYESRKGFEITMYEPIK